MCSTTRANTSPCAARSTSPARSKAGRSSSRPGPPTGRPAGLRAGARGAAGHPGAGTGEAVFTAQASLAAGREFYADVKARAEKAGRSRDHVKILPACFVVVGDTVEDARAK